MLNIEGMMNVDILAPLDHSLFEAENQRTKRSQILDLKVTCAAKAIKKIRERDSHCLEAMVEVPSISGPWTTPSSKPFDFPLLSNRLG